MKKKIVVPIIIGIIITISVILLNSNQGEPTYEEIVEETLGEKWLREQVRSGPFSIDKGQYNIGEKIFISVVNLPENEKGEMIFFRPTNSTTLIDYIALPFNGESKSQFNLYFQPQLSVMKKICSTDELTGTWIVKFVGTQYSDLSFELLNQTSSWDTRTFEPVC